MFLFHWENRLHTPQKKAFASIVNHRKNYQKTSKKFYTVYQT